MNPKAERASFGKLPDNLRKDNASVNIDVTPSGSDLMHITDKKIIEIDAEVPIYFYGYRYPQNGLTGNIRERFRPS